MTLKLSLSVVTVVDVAASACLKRGSQVTMATASVVPSKPFLTWSLLLMALALKVVHQAWCLCVYHNNILKKNNNPEKI